MMPGDDQEKPSGKQRRGSSVRTSGKLGATSPPAGPMSPTGAQLNPGPGGTGSASKKKGIKKLPSLRAFNTSDSPSMEVGRKSANSTKSGSKGRASDISVPAVDSKSNSRLRSDRSSDPAAPLSRKELSPPLYPVSTNNNSRRGMESKPPLIEPVSDETPGVVDSVIGLEEPTGGSDRVMEIVYQHGENELLETAPEAHKEGSKKLVRSRSLQKFQEMVFPKGAAGEGGEMNRGRSQSAAEKSQRGFNSKDAGGDEAPTGGGLVRSLSAIKLFEAGQEQAQPDVGDESPRQTLVRTASRLDLAEDQVKVIRRGNSAIAIPKPEVSKQIEGRRQRESIGVEVDNTGSVAFVKNTGSSMKYRRMLREELPEPPLYLSSYGVGDWWIDVFSLYHNALRREMQDMYYMLTSMHKRVLTLAHDDVNQFFDWFDVFVMFLEWYFKVEEIALYPWVEERLVMPDELQKLPRLQLKAQVVEIVKTVDECLGKFDYLPAGEVLPSLLNGVGTFAPMLVGYFRRVEKQVCPLIKEAFTEDDKKKLDHRCIEVLWNSDENGFLLECLARPLSTEDGRRELRRSYLERRSAKKGEMVIVSTARKRMNFVKNKREFYTDHQRIVDEFFNKWQSAYEEAEREEYMPQQFQSTQ